MNPNTFEQYSIPGGKLGKAIHYPLTEIKITVGFYEGQLVQVILPTLVEMEIITTVETIHHEQDNTFKSAKLNNGMEILVPQFIKQGERVNVEIESGKYHDRVKSKH